MYLSLCDPPTSISSLRDLGDGHSLVLLTEKLLSREKKMNVVIKRQMNPKSEIHIRENINVALENLKNHGRVIITIDAPRKSSFFHFFWNFKWNTVEQNYITIQKL